MYISLSLSLSLSLFLSLFLSLDIPLFVSLFLSISLYFSLFLSISLFSHSFIFSLMHSCKEAIPVLTKGFVEFSENSRNIIFSALNRPIGSDKELKEFITEIRRESKMNSICF
jgi:hypothetical protein